MTMMRRCEGVKEMFIIPAIPVSTYLMRKK